jgi:hypothetical protein
VAKSPDYMAGLAPNGDEGNGVTVTWSLDNGPLTLKWTQGRSAGRSVTLRRPGRARNRAGPNGGPGGFRGDRTRISLWPHPHRAIDGRPVGVCSEISPNADERSGSPGTRAVWDARRRPHDGTARGRSTRTGSRRRFDPEDVAGDAVVRSMPSVIDERPTAPLDRRTHSVSFRTPGRLCRPRVRRSEARSIGGREKTSWSVFATCRNEKDGEPCRHIRAPDCVRGSPGCKQNGGLVCTPYRRTRRPAATGPVLERDAYAQACRLNRPIGT